MQFQVGSGTPSEERAYALMSQVHQQACRQFRIGRHWCSWVLLFVANEGACAAFKVHQQACSTVCGMGWGSWATGAGSDQPADRLAS